MSSALTLCVAVGDDERPLVVAAARQLAAAVSAALGRTWPVSIERVDPERGNAAGQIWIASLMDDVSRKEDIDATARRWLARIERWSYPGKPRILLSTLFRHVPPSPGGRITIERLRRLNWMGMYLSRSAGIEIVDIDRLFALCGARALGTDYRCLGPHAAELGGHAIAAAILAGNMDKMIPAPIQEAAARRHGGILDVAAVVQRRVVAS
ncbi:hypothetical protein [Novosphingobium lentum]|uniref:hypothetical protein n=1 Tax=Novosphingobium lentum TaxID=145287 RepID=UPI0008357D54|nr:hypothetical protein [Novosphingobium lentum]